MTPVAGHRGLLVAAVVAGVALLVAGVSVVVLVDSGDRGPANHAYGAVACTSPTLPGTTVTVAVSDAGAMTMAQAPMGATLVASPTTVPAGQISLVVPNTGALVHELVILPLPADGPGTRTTGTDGKIDESASRGEASRSCAAGTGDGITPGSTGWTTVTLTPGRYELACDMPWHYAAGMFDVLTVT